MEKVIKFVREELKHDNSGHGLQHALRVYDNAKKILKNEKGDEKIVLTSALIHDTVDRKLFDNFDERIEYVKKFLKKNKYSKNEVDEIIYIISNISWKNGKNEKLNSLNAEIVRDADRLDAIGAIGVIRTIEFGNSRNRNFYDEVNVATDKKGNKTFDKNTTSTLTHFYEKLLLIKDSVHTKTAHKMAIKRHKFMLKFLKEFYEEI